MADHYERAEATDMAQDRHDDEVRALRLIAEAALRWRDAKCAGAPECSAYEEDHGDKSPVTVTTMALREALEGWTP